MQITSIQYILHGTMSGNGKNQTLGTNENRKTSASDMYGNPVFFWFCVTIVQKSSLP